MKFIVSSILFFFISQYLWSKDFTFKSTGKTVRNEVTKFPDGSKFISFRHEGGFETDMAKYGIYKCHGSILYNKESTLENMIFACDNKDQNGDTYITMGKRKKGSAVDRAIGQSEILDGTGFWKDFIGFTCTYAIEYVDDVVFVPGKCIGSK
tara:strand:- start:175 stop:630 length:456 start_codon:yes stop_codon:yes gene_type:complete